MTYQTNQTLLLSTVLACPTLLRISWVYSTQYNYS